VFKNIRYENIVRWEDYIIFGRGTYDEKTEIYYYDLSTNNKSLIYEKDLPKGGMEAILSYFDVLEGSLYFSIGGYIQDGTLFQMDLPYTNPPQKIINLPNSKIVEIDNRQFIVGGDGDGCGGYAEYALFDPITQTASPIITKEGMGCVEGNTTLGIYKNTFITSYHKEQPDGIGVFNHIYTNVKLTQLAPPYTEQILISELEMPQSIFHVEYVEEQKKLYIIGEKIYEFYLNTNTLQELIPLPIDNDNFAQNAFCDGARKPNGNIYLSCSTVSPSSSTFELNITNNTISELENIECEDCNYEGYFSVKESAMEELSIEEIEKELYLPEEYEVYCYQ
jgi:hypothetical protein